MNHRGRKNQYDKMVVPEPPPRERPPLPPTEPPSHLTDEMKAWFVEVDESYVLGHHDLHVLRLACEAFDRAQSSRQQVEREGSTFVDKNGNLRAHPSLAVQRDAAALFAKLVKQLDLPSPETGAPAWERSLARLGAHRND